ncbi:MAG: inositol monophosphatase family protein [Holophaga sp.]|nr:inositol monophosphatase family protein [Holophaga sp.]
MFEAQREACVAAALAGGRVLVPFFRKLEPGAIIEKSKNDYVSEADRASEAAIKAELDRRFPQYSFLGEETGASGDSSRVWIVDPLDGTLNFVQGFPHWCVSVALWDAQGPVVGCVWDPLRQDLFLATRGEGATWNGQRMAISTQSGLDGAFLATGFAYQLGERFKAYSRALDAIFYRAKGIRRAGSAALDLAHVAAGIYDGFFEMGLQKWDMAAGVLLVQEAGGLISDWEGGEGWFESGNVLAGNLWVQQELTDAVKG